MTYEGHDPDIMKALERPIGLGCALDMFSEKEEVIAIIKSLPDIFLDLQKVERTHESFQTILDNYQEQPHLLDPHLESMINACLAIYRAAESPATLRLRHLSLKFIRQIFKVRGPKQVVKRMPHEISDLVPVLAFLECLDLEDGRIWESGFVLILWLSILVMNPFHLKLLDGGDEGGSIAERIRALCLKAAVINNNVGHVAPVLISSFLTRPDMQKLYMESFIEWACANLGPHVKEFGVRMGAFGCLTSLFKHGKRQELLKYGKKVLAATLESEYEKSDTLVRKLGTKLLQRIGMLFMKTRIASWRYQRGRRTLLANLQGYANGASSRPVDSNENTVDADEYDELNEYSSEIESILDRLLNALQDKDTVVRYSGSKGIGRVTNRLPKEMADEVVQSILSSFTDRASLGTWHGGGMALAELGRRGLLLPETLPVAIPIIKKAMLWSEVRGSFTVGGIVRDSACYVLWSFARAFEPSVLQPYVHDVAEPLLMMMLFDREVNCRRAAQAAFQENVGRQGNIPRGLDVIAIADFHAISILTNAYLDVCPQIAKFPEYIRPMVDHLIEHKFHYNEPRVRNLTSQALAFLARLDPEYVLKMIIEKIVPVATGSSVQVSHGAVLCVGNVMVALTEIGKFDLPPQTFTDIRNIVKGLVNGVFRQIPFGCMPLREAACYFIKCCAISKFPVHEDTEILKIWDTLLAQCVCYCADTVRLEAAEAYPEVLKEYYYSNPTKHPELRGFLSTFCGHLKSATLEVRWGYALCFGKFSPVVLKVSFTEVINSLIQCASNLTLEEIELAEARRRAMYALANIFEHGIVPVEAAEDWTPGIPIGAFDFESIFACLFHGMVDYSISSRGDVGSFVRQASMTATKHLILSLYKCEKQGNMQGRILTPERMTKALGLILKQCVEKIDNVRVYAATVFSEIMLFEDPPIDCLPDRAGLSEIFPKAYFETVNWRASSDTFPKFAQLMKIESFTYFMLSGFVLSGGSLSDSVLKDANNAVSSYLKAAAGTGELERIGKTFLTIFQDYRKNDRVSLPLLKFMTQLLQSSIFLPLLTEGNERFGIDLSDCVKNELVNSTRVEKIASGIELLCELMQGSVALLKTVLRRLVVYLCHSYPRIRTLTAEKLYEALTTYGESLEDTVDLDGAMTILSDSQWTTGTVEELRPIRNNFCDLMDIPKPTLIVKKKP